MKQGDDEMPAGQVTDLGLTTEIPHRRAARPVGVPQILVQVFPAAHEMVPFFRSTTPPHRLPGNWTCKPRFPRSTPDTSVTFLPDTMTTDSPTPLLSTTRPFRTVTKDARVSPSPGRTSRRNLGYGAKPSTYTPTRPPSFRQTLPSGKLRVPDRSLTV